MALTFHKVTALPGTLVADAVYIVSTSAPIAEIYITDSSANARRVINTADVQAMINTSLAATGGVEIVADIAARNALVQTANGLVMVLDATADTTVTTGAATYAYRHANTSYTKISEAESMDVVLQWANIQGKPTSTVAQIDDAVTKRHTHANKTQLDLVGQDGAGNMTYNGNPVVPGWSTTAW